MGPPPRIGDGLLRSPAFMSNVNLAVRDCDLEGREGCQTRSQRALAAGFSIRGRCVENSRRRYLIGRIEVGGFGCANASTYTAKFLEAPCTRRSR